MPHADPKKRKQYQNEWMRKKRAVEKLKKEAWRKKTNNHKYKIDGETYEETVLRLKEVEGESQKERTKRLKHESFKRNLTPERRDLINKRKRERLLELKKDDEKYRQYREKAKKWENPKKDEDPTAYRIWRDKENAKKRAKYASDPEHRKKYIKKVSDYYWKNQKEILERTRVWREENKERINSEKMERYYANHEENKAKGRANYSRNKHKIRKRQRDRYHSDPEYRANLLFKQKEYVRLPHNLERRRKYEKEYRKKNAENLKIKRRKYYLANTEARIEYSKLYVILNREKVMAYRKNYRLENAVRIANHKKKDRLLNYDNPNSHHYMLSDRYITQCLLYDVKHYMPKGFKYPKALIEVKREHLRLEREVNPRLKPIHEKRRRKTKQYT